MPRLSVTLVSLALISALAGCSGDEPAAEVARPEPSSTYVADVPVIVPGAPGEEPEIVQPGESGTIPNADAYGDADVRFMTDMVGHHAQALEMAQLAPDRAQDERVLRLAERIAAGQRPEIDAMQAWLEQHGLPEAPEEVDHEHSDMPGMATPEDLTRLSAAEGTEFDRMFLELMSRHHEGALRMAERAVGARHPVVSELVDDVVATQSVEISRMQKVLGDLPA